LGWVVSFPSLQYFKKIHFNLSLKFILSARIPVIIVKRIKNLRKTKYSMYSILVNYLDGVLILGNFFNYFALIVYLVTANPNNAKKWVMKIKTHGKKFNNFYYLKIK
jgi:hypothetical protein